jgi:hypothetical protein
MSHLPPPNKAVNAPHPSCGYRSLSSHAGGFQIASELSSALAVRTRSGIPVAFSYAWPSTTLQDTAAQTPSSKAAYVFRPKPFSKPALSRRGKLSFGLLDGLVRNSRCLGLGRLPVCYSFRCRKTLDCPQMTLLLTANPLRRHVHYRTRTSH